MPIPSVNTPRLLLRAFSDEDADAFHRILCGRDVLRYFPKTDPPPRERVGNMIRSVLRHWEERGCGLWAVTLRETGELTGRCGLQRIEETGETELDVILGTAYWGRGYATEACRAGLRFGAATLRPEEIVGIVHPENAASRRLVEKLGFTLTGRARYFEMDCVRYAMGREVLVRLYGGEPAGR